MSSEPNLRLLDPRDFARGLRADEERARVRGKRIDMALETAILILTAWSIWILTSEAPRWGFVVGLASQPFYIVATWRARRWGMFIVAWMLCGFWSRGIVNHFF